MSSISHTAYQLGSFAEVLSLVSELQKRFPGKYGLEKSGKEGSFTMWLLSEDSEEYIDYAMFYEQRKKAFVVGSDAFAMMQRIFSQVL